MTYKTLYNYPAERKTRFYSSCGWDNAFSDDELKSMCDFFDSQGVERGTTVGDVESSKQNDETKTVLPSENTRVSNVKFFNFEPLNENTNWIFQRLNFVIESLNNQYYNFNLNGYESFQYTEYNAHEGGKYDFHMDSVMGPAIPNNMIEMRKLSLTLCLNEPGEDYEGGEFQINSSEEKFAETIHTKKGKAILFPSFMLHRVAPVTKGKRKSLVVWVTGPKFL